MKCKTLFNTLSKNKLSKLSSKGFSQKNDSAMPVVALVAGLAIGAALSVLFAPKKGEETRTKIADGANELSDAMMRRFKEVKKRLLRETDIEEVQDKVVKNVRKTTKKAADKLTGPEDETKNVSDIKVAGTASKAWKENMDD